MHSLTIKKPSLRHGTLLWGALLLCTALGCAAQSDDVSGAEQAAETDEGTTAVGDALGGSTDRLAAGEAGLAEDLIPADGRRVDHRLAFAGQPTEDELRALAAADVRVLDLRRPEESRGFDQSALAAETGLVYTNVPVDAPALGDPEVHRAFKEAIEADGELVVHCASGNRVAGLYYAYLVTEKGASRAEAKTRAKELGLTSPGVEKGTDAYLDAVVGAQSEP